MSDFIMAFSAVFPMFFFIALGGCISKLGWLERKQFQDVNQMIFKLLIPTMLFVNIYQSDFRQSADPKLIGGTLIFLLAVFGLVCLIVPRFVKERADASVMIQGIYRSNYVLFGTTMAANVYPDADLGQVSAVAAFLVPVFNILAVVLFETMRGSRVRPGQLLGKMLQNPLIIGGVLGIFFALTRLRLPALLVDTLSEAGQIASPMALICLGGMLSFQSVLAHWQKLTTVLVGRLILVPIAALGVFAFLGYRDLELVMILAAFGSPAAVASAPMAQAMGGNSELAGEIVAASSAACIITIFFFLWFMKISGLIA